jgi:hypothetical protein
VINLTLGQAKEEAIQHMGERTKNGDLIDLSDPSLQDYMLAMNPLANSAQLELCKIKKIPAKMTKSQNPISNLLGIYAMNEDQHFPGTNKTYTSSGAQSFSIEVDRPCQLKFEEYESGAWQDISGTYITPGGEETSFNGTITIGGISAFTNYKGLLPLTTPTNSVRLTITATYPMKSRYRALFGYTFEDANAVPRYAAYVPYEFPADYMEFDKMTRAYDERQLNENSDYKGPFYNADTKRYEILINWHLTGEFYIYYYKYPTVITNDTPDSYEFEVDIDAQSLIPWFIGGYAIYKENQSIGVQLLNQYYALLERLNTTDTAQPGAVVTGGW